MSNYRIIYYSLFLPKKLTEDLLGERSHYHHQIIRIKRYCHCDIQGDATTQIILQDDYFTMTEISYDRKLGDHFTCMRMLNMLFKQTRLDESPTFKCIPYRFILRDIKGLYHTINLEKESVRSWSQLPAFFPPSAVDELLNIGRHEVPPQCHTPDLKHMTTSVSMDEESTGVDNLLMESFEKRFSHQVITADGSVSAVSCIWDKWQSSMHSCRVYDESKYCQDKSQTNEKSVEQDRTVMDHNDLVDNTMATNRPCDKNPSFKNIIGRIFDNIEKVKSATRHKYATEKLENRSETSITVTSKSCGDLFTFNCNNSKHHSAKIHIKKRLPDRMIPEERSKINVTVAVKTSKEHHSRKLATRKDLDSLFNLFPRFLHRCKEAMPRVPTRKLLNEMMLILDKEPNFDEWQISNANDSDKKGDLEKAHIETTTSELVNAIERRVFRSLYSGFLDIQSLNIAKKNYHKIAVDTSLDDISEIVSGIQSEPSVHDHKERSSIKWNRGTILKDFSPPGTMSIHEGLMEHESLAAIQSAGGVEKPIKSSSFSKRSDTFEIDEEHNWYSFSNQRPILKEIYEDLLKEIVSSIVQPCMKSRD